MKFKVPLIPAWAVVVLALLAGAASVAAEVLWPRHAIGPPLEGQTGFYAGAGFAAALIVLGGAWIARLLRDGPDSDTHSGA